MSAPIGYYVHHQGEGHRQRALSIAACEPERFVLMGTGVQGGSSGIRSLELPDDRPIDARRECEDGAADSSALHYAPQNHHGIRERVALLCDWVREERPALIVIDVSVEIAMLARLTGTPYCYVRLGGARADPPHLEAFRFASLLLAPFARDLDDPDVPAWVAEKTLYCPGITVGARTSRSPVDPDLILVVQGRGGGALDGETVKAAAAATPRCRWRVIGPATNVAGPPANLVFSGWVDNPADDIARAGVIVGAAGDGLVSAVIAAGKPFVAIPEPRPFGEQASKAAQLERLGAAITLASWPAPSAWPDILAKARALRPQDINRLHDGHGAKTAARLILAAAGAAEPYGASEARRSC
jgi:predicted glycosyltransferase